MFSPYLPQTIDVTDSFLGNEIKLQAVFKGQRNCANIFQFKDHLPFDFQAYILSSVCSKKGSLTFKIYIDRYIIYNIYIYIYIYSVCVCVKNAIFPILVRQTIES